MRTWLLLILLLLLGVTWWASRPEPANDSPGTTGNEQLLDYFVEALELRQFDSQGKLSHILQADQLRHFRDSGITRLQQPRYVLYENQQPAWTIEAKAGLLTREQDLLQLLGDTRIDWQGNEQNPPMQLQTSDLDIHPRREFAETEQAVTVTSGQNWIESVGMQAWLKAPGRIRFLAQTRAHYVAK